MSRPSSRTYPAGERQERTAERRRETEQGRLPQRTARSVDVVDSGTPTDTADSREDARSTVAVSSSPQSPQSSESSLASSQSSESSLQSSQSSESSLQSSPQSSTPLVDSSTSLLDRLGAVETRIRRLESELDRLGSEQGFVDVQSRENRRGGRSKRDTWARNRTQRRSRKPLRDRNDDRNLLPKQQGSLLPKKNDNLLRKLFWP
ncbi:hypothetical protein [Haloprofundus sp. MHR1]|uniref:hypothetical protein n=1 Tax=Haloprofundus sp. MHR1 TaxID=2572921 RepID=UPI0010BE5BAD|nr:hypothetical protein [Haloprofundus sp. MHR1]QCJ46791.1 hypothetical protein FCF25_06565 [Haloprofundus sp. MHR1]